MGLSPFEAPSTYSLLQFTELVDGVWFPIGGMYRIIQSMVSIAEKFGVRFLYKRPVKRLEISGKKVRAVIMEDGTQMEADLIIANADLPYVFSELLPDNHRAKRLERKKFTCSAIMFYWGVERQYPELMTHNLFVSGDYKYSMDQVFRDKLLPDEPNFYVHAPMRVDPTSAPVGQDTLMVLVPCGHLDEFRHQDFSAMQSMARKSVFKRLHEIGINDLEQHIKFEVSYSPTSWKKITCQRVGRNFSRSEWTQYFPNEPYPVNQEDATCPQWPLEPAP